MRAASLAAFALPGFRQQNRISSAAQVCGDVSPTQPRAQPVPHLTLDVTLVCARLGLGQQEGEGPLVALRSIALFFAALS
jgi:hypothetical protein